MSIAFSASLLKDGRSFIFPQETPPRAYAGKRYISPGVSSAIFLIVSAFFKGLPKAIGKTQETIFIFFFLSESGAFALISEKVSFARFSFYFSTDNCLFQPLSGKNGVTSIPFSA